MKRWPIVLLLLLAVIVFLSPGIVGHLAEKNLDENLSWLESENDDLSFTSMQFERGWFTSEGRHRVTLKNGAIFGSAGMGDVVSGDTPSLIIETHLDHGLVPLASLGREEGSLIPALGNSVSTLKIEHADGTLTDLPGRIYSRIGLTGNSSFHFTMAAGSQTDSDSEVTWSGANITLTTQPAKRSFHIEADIQPTTMMSYGVTTDVGPVTFDIRQDRSQFAYGVGSLKLTIDSSTVSRPGEPMAGFGAIVVDMENELDGERLNGHSAISLNRVLVPGNGPVDVELEVAVNGIDARSLGSLMDALQEAREAALASNASPVVPPQVLDKIENIFNKGLDITFERVDLSLPQGDFSSTISIDIPESDGSGFFSWPTVLLATTAAADFSMSVSLFEWVQTINPEATTLLALGMLKRNGENYEMEARYEKGLLTINGAPMPIPLSLL